MCFRKTKHAEFSKKTTIYNPLITHISKYPRTKAYQGVRNVRFLVKFGMLCFLETPVLRFAFLPYYQQYSFSHPTSNRLKQTKVYHTFFYFLWKEATHKSLKVAAAKTIFSSVYPFGMTCFDVFYFMW